MPKTRQTIYVVVRKSTYPNQSPTTVLDSFFSSEAASEACGRYEQQMKERGITGLSFISYPSTYYDE